MAVLVNQHAPGAHSMATASQATGTAAPDPSKTIVTVVVPANTPWTDTGIDVQAGDALEIRAWGRATVDSLTSKTASPTGLGRGPGGCAFVVTDPAVPAYALVGNVSPDVTFDGRGFYVGPSWKGSVPVSGTSARSGRLLLGLNGNAVLCDRSGFDSWAFGVNRSGWFTAEIALTRLR